MFCFNFDEDLENITNRYEVLAGLDFDNDTAMNIIEQELLCKDSVLYSCWLMCCLRERVSKHSVKQ